MQTRRIVILGNGITGVTAARHIRKRTDDRIVGVGFYPLMGTRVWCRFGCPMAAILGLLQRFNSRFRITTNGAQCISCGNYCEMGIDVRFYAQRGQNIIRSSCVGCGMYAAVCLRGVLSLENCPQGRRTNRPGGLSLLGGRKAL
jgi:ferredoxin-type protein NapH